MHYAQTLKAVAMTPPGAIVDNAAFTTAAVDTKGFNYLSILVHFGAMDIAMASMKVQESDDSGMSGAVDISGTTGGTDFTLPIDTDDNTFGWIHIKCGGPRKRYIDLVATGGNGTLGTYMTAIGLLSEGAELPDTATDQGASFRVVV